MCGCMRVRTRRSAHSSLAQTASDVPPALRPGDQRLAEHPLPLVQGVPHVAIGGAERLRRVTDRAALCHRGQQFEERIAERGAALLARFEGVAQVQPQLPGRRCRGRGALGLGRRVGLGYVAWAAPTNCSAFAVAPQQRCPAELHAHRGEHACAARPDAPADCRYWRRSGCWAPPWTSSCGR